MIEAFSFAATPHIQFGAGKRDMLPDIAAAFGERLLLVTGSASFDRSKLCGELLAALAARMQLERLQVRGEPSPSLVDDAVQEFRSFQPDAVLAVGGGSAIDAGKAIAGLLPLGHSVMEYLEGVGRGKNYPGPSLPFVAVPTTAGTGGETSKNAVLSVRGEGGFKKSFRHEQLVARAVVIDPELHLDCPPEITAACGMDALTQLLESYVSSKASPMTDALAESGMMRARDHLLTAYHHGDNLAARAGMAYASTLSGLTLANAGLGSVHGLASPLGAFFPIPHGIICGTLVAEATRTNLRALKKRAPVHPSLAKYARAGRLLVKDPHLSDVAAMDALPARLEAWAEELRLPRLAAYGISEGDVARIVADCRGSSMHTNPIELSDAEVAAIVRARL